MNALAAHTKLKVTFSDPNFRVKTDSLPHVQMCRTLVAIIANAPVEIMSDHLQHESEDRMELPSAGVVDLLRVHSQMATVALTSCVMHYAMFVDTPPLSIFQAVKASPGDDQLTAPGLATEPLCMIYASAGSVSSLRKLIATDGLADFDNQRYCLRRPVSQCRQWLACMEKFLSGIQSLYLQRVSVDIRKRAEELEASTPRWDVVFPKNGFDESLAKTRLLEHPKRNTIKPALRYLQAAFKGVFAHASAWKVDHEFSSAAQSFVKSSIQTGNSYLLLVAAANIAIVMKDRPGGAKNASEVLALATKAEDFSMPPALHRILVDMAAGVPPSAVGSASSKRSAPLHEGPHDDVDEHGEIRAPKKKTNSILKSAAMVKREVDDDRNAAATPSAASASSSETAAPKAISLLKRAKMELQATQSPSKIGGTPTGKAGKGKNTPKPARGGSPKRRRREGLGPRA